MEILKSNGALDLIESIRIPSLEDPELLGLYIST